jgi:AmmeMemoRadiSam system protein A
MASEEIDWRNASREKRLLLDVARRALTSAVICSVAIDDFPPDEILSRPGGAFVTLRRRGRLRGCIGQFATDLPLAQVIADCAIAAGREDPRFRAIKPDELDEIEIEISILSTSVEIAPDMIQVGKHGLIVSSGEQRGVLLPQVATQFNWTPERFLQEACFKAGLDQNAWKISGTRIEAFTAVIFTESDARPASKKP